MSTNDMDDQVAEVLDARDGRSAVASGAERVLGQPGLRGLLEAADLAWGSAQGAPPLADDPLAAMLGLVPDPDLELDGKALTVARKARGLTVSTVAQQLTARGWDVTSRDVFAWESGKNCPRVPALINALSDVVRADPDRLRRRIGADAERERLSAVLNSAPFVALAERWARIQGTSVALASSALQSRMLVAVHRGGAPDTETLLTSLETMVSAVEDTGSS